MSSGQKQSLSRHFRRLVMALACFFSGGYFFSFKAPDPATLDERFKELGFAFLGFLFIASGALCLIAPLGQLLSSVFESIFWPAVSSGTPPPMYKLAEWYIGQNRFNEAVAEYHKIIRHHPRDEIAWQGLLYVQHACLRDEKEGERIYRLAEKKLKPEQRTALTEYYTNLQAGRMPRPDHAGSTET